VPNLRIHSLVPVLYLSAIGEPGVSLVVGVAIGFWIHLGCWPPSRRCRRSRPVLFVAQVADAIDVQATLAHR